MIYDFWWDTGGRSSHFLAEGKRDYLGARFRARRKNLAGSGKSESITIRTGK